MAMQGARAGDACVPKMVMITRRIADAALMIADVGGVIWRGECKTCNRRSVKF
jgi:hypothetical protein